MEQLKDVMKEVAKYGVISSFTVLPLMLVSKNEATDLNEMMGKDGSFNNSAYKSELYRNVITKRILDYDEKGLLDC